MAPRSSSKKTKRTGSSWTWKQWLTRVVVPLIGSSVVHQKWTDSRNNNNNDNDSRRRITSSNSYNDETIPCNFVMAESSLPHGGWGIYTLRDWDAGTPLWDLASPILQLINLQNANLQFPGLDHLLDSYLWDGTATLGQFEGHTAHSLAPGMGMLANAHLDILNIVNAKPLRSHNAQHLHASHNARRYESPVAGSATSYQEFTYETAKSISSGDELIISYGPGWTEKMKAYAQQEQETMTNNRRAKNIDWLIANGRCLDRIRPLKLPAGDDRGHGIAANQPLAAHQPIVSVPFLPLHRSALQMPSSTSSSNADETLPKQQQLALNYVFGHAQSNLLLLPYSPTFPLINHPRAPYQTANARLEWDMELSKRWQTASVDNVLRRTPQGPGSALVANLVALHDIAVGEEIVLDYGTEWQAAWEKHEQAFGSSKNSNQQQQPYVYPHDLNQQSSVLRDRHEQQANPYPAHILPICLWDPHAAIAHTERQGSLVIRQTTWNETSTTASVLLPCKILERHNAADGEHGNPNDAAYRYTVQIYEPDAGRGLQHLEAGEMRVVENMPRQAITFVDQPYQSDQHLPNAFRHEMRSLAYPPQWLDDNGVQ